MEDLFVEVRVIQIDLPRCTQGTVVPLFALLTGASHAFCLERRLVRLQHYIGTVILVENVEVVVVASRKDFWPSGPQRASNLSKMQSFS